MEAINAHKGYEVQPQGHGGQVGNCILFQDTYLYFPTIT